LISKRGEEDTITVTIEGMLDNIDVGFKDEMENSGLVTMATEPRNIPPFPPNLNILGGNVHTSSKKF
jgi:hypothetical protein